MKVSQLVLIVTVIGLLLPASHAAAEEQEASDIGAAIASGEVSLSGRYRYEHVDQDNSLDDADASTLRLRLNYRTGRWNGWSGFAEFDHIFHVLVDDFNSGGGNSPNRSQYSVVADPDGSDLNQMYLDYSWEEAWKFRFGRQRILLDNHRFVGNVGWRQNEQTYDALTLNTSAIVNTALSYSYVNQVRRIFGQSVSSGKASLDGHLINAKINLPDDWALTPYLYHLDYKDDAFAGSSTSTIGVWLSGSFKAGDGKIDLLAEFARQSDAGDNPANYDANYMHLVGSWTMDNGFSVGLAFESLGGSSDPGEAFRTPLATLHAFNGWADVFLTTPDAGIDDTYFTVKYRLGLWNLAAIYHDFTAETGSSDYGTEVDFSAGRKLGERYGLLLKGAFFSADSSASQVDTDKIWIMLTGSY